MILILRLDLSRSTPSPIELEDPDRWVKLPNEILLRIFHLAVEGATPSERASFGLSVMLLAKNWRAVGLQIVFGPIPSFVHARSFCSFYRLTKECREYAHSVTRMRIVRSATMYKSCKTGYPYHLTRLRHVCFEHWVIDFPLDWHLDGERESRVDRSDHELMRHTSQSRVSLTATVVAASRDIWFQRSAGFAERNLTFLRSHDSPSSTSTSVEQIRKPSLIQAFSRHCGTSQLTRFELKPIGRISWQRPCPRSRLRSRACPSSTSPRRRGPTTACAAVAT